MERQQRTFVEPRSLKSAWTFYPLHATYKAAVYGIVFSLPNLMQRFSYLSDYNLTPRRFTLAQLGKLGRGGFAIGIFPAWHRYPLHDASIVSFHSLRPYARRLIRLLSRLVPRIDGIRPASDGSTLLPPSGSRSLIPRSSKYFISSLSFCTAPC
jgi:hypothetical protein